MPGMLVHQVEEVRLPQDARGFVRRACPSCERHFKVQVSAAEESLVLSALVTAVPHANVAEVASPPARACPYCGHVAPSEQFLTPVQRTWLEGWTKSVNSALKAEQLRQVARRLRENPYVTFNVVAPVDPPEAPPGEPDDMAVARVACCGEEVKLKRSWREPFYCPHCRTKQAARVPKAGW